MKKLVLILAAVLIVSVAVVHAQQRDTTRNQNPSRDMIKVEAKDLPASLQKTLEGSEYSGWQSGKFYRSKSSDQFLVVIGEGDRMKPYYFDAKGKPIRRK